jgi:hypothetical protein
MLLLQEFHNGLKQALDTFISEEATLLSIYILQENKRWIPRLPNI